MKEENIQSNKNTTSIKAHAKAEENKSSKDLRNEGKKKGQ